MITNLKGWKRLGIVFSIFWTAYVCYSAFSEMNSVGKCTQFKYGHYIQCHETDVVIKDNGQVKIEFSDGGSFVTNLQMRAYEARPDYKQIAFDIANPILFGWILAFIMYFLGKWVIRGFRNNA